MKANLGGSIEPHITDLGTRMKLVVSFTSLPLYPQERAPVPIGRRLL